MAYWYTGSAFFQISQSYYKYVKMNNNSMGLLIFKTANSYFNFKNNEVSKKNSIRGINFVIFIRPFQLVIMFLVY